VHHHVIIRVTTRLLVPFILLFALYVQFHGDFGPGGGFQAGVIFGAGCILYGLVFGVDALLRVVPQLAVRIVATGGLLLYAGVGVAGQHLGILLIELGVGMTVATVVISLYYGFTNR
jgi:multicomponent Na+:H+ antiporter subunit B